MPISVALALVWWFAFAGLGLFFPFYSLYLSENAGLAGSEVGLVLAMLPLTGLVVQPLWGQLADRTGLRAGIVTLLAGGTSVGYAMLTQADGLASFLLCTVMLAVFSSALVPSCVSVTLALLPDGKGFGRARVMGTLAFGVSVLSFPFVLRAFQSAGHGAPPARAEGEPGLELIFCLASAFLALTAVLSLWLPARGDVSQRAQRGQWRELFDNAAFIRVLIFTFLAYLTIQGPTVLLPILVRDQGGGLDAISRMWLLMIALEVPLVYHFGATWTRFGARGVLQIGMCAAALRWAISGFGEDLHWVYGAQLLHGVTVWGIVLGTPLYANDVVPAHLRATGQGLLAMLGVSLGSIVSNFGSGWLVEAVGPRAPAQIASVVSLLLALALPWMLPRTRSSIALLDRTSG